MSILKKIILAILILFFLFSCYLKRKIYDIDPPEVEFYKQMDEALFIQFNEPINSIKLFLNNEIELTPFFPKTNFNFPYQIFKDFTQKNFKIVVVDTSKNVSENIIQTPIVNMNPAIILFDEIRIKYSKNNPQFIKFKVKKAGSLNGFTLVIFLKNEKVIIPFVSENIETLDVLTLLITINEDNENKIIPLSFKKRKDTVILKNRLSQLYSLIMILDNKDELIDYILYYNLKKHDKEYYEKNKKFSILKNEILKRANSYKIIDISKTGNLYCE